MDIEMKRSEARNCWKMASKFTKLSPAAQKLIGAFGGSTFRMPSNRLVDVTRKNLQRELDEMVLVDDPSVRIMALMAMRSMGYRSRHIGFIATLCTSREVGHILKQEGGDMSSEEVSRTVRSYFADLLNVPNYFDDLRRCAGHWDGVLSIDYTEYFSIESWWDFSGGEAKHVYRNVPPEEVAVQISENKAQINALYKHDLRELFEKRVSGYYEQRALEVYQCFEEIFSHIFRNGSDVETIGAVLEMLDRCARSGHFPEKRLMELSQKYAAH